jgi:hypothetical protein
LTDSIHVPESIVKASISHTDLKITNEVLLQALSSEKEFDSLYESMSNKVIRGFQLCNRPRNVAILKGDISSIKLARNNIPEAAAGLNSICFKLSEHGWFLLDAFYIKKLAECHRRSDVAKGLIDCNLHLLSHPECLKNEELVQCQEELLKYSSSIPDSIKI